MNKEELLEKVRKRHRETLSLAANLDAALRKKEEREELSKMVEEERAELDKKKRIFVKPKTADEADGELPKIKKKEKDSILESGTLIEKMRLYFKSVDLSGYFGTRGKLSKAEKAKIIASIQTLEEKRLFNLCLTEFDTLKAFGYKLSYFFKEFQTSLAILAKLLNQLDVYNEFAEKIHKMFILNLENAGQVECSVQTGTTDTDLAQRYLKAIGHDRSTIGLAYDRKKGFFADFSKSGLSAKIQEAAKRVTSDLCDFKAYAIVAEDFCQKSKLQYMPTNISVFIANAKEERYARFLVDNLSYFRSELNVKEINGETIPEESELQAVIPDYYEVEPTEEIYNDCKKGIQNTYQRFYNIYLK